ncbi:MAG: putative toxin-antitoxin system toxin component, PIN family [Oscillospiraceae bacterium]|nr:putative toxin-antitoxin system toxin component, PIN family [Oscillospiraceae bacterium]
MLDTNILVSAALFQNSKTAQSLEQATRDHTLLICTYVLEEVQSVFARKFPDKTARLDLFLSKLAYELCYTARISANTPSMRDEDDRPILQAAIDAEADAILTGDDDFHALNLEHPVIISPTDFVRDILHI